MKTKRPSRQKGRTFSCKAGAERYNRHDVPTERPTGHLGGKNSLHGEVQTQLLVMVGIAIVGIFILMLPAVSPPSTADWIAYQQTQCQALLPEQPERIPVRYVKPTNPKDPNTSWRRNTRSHLPTIHTQGHLFRQRRT